MRPFLALVMGRALLLSLVAYTGCSPSGQHPIGTTSGTTSGGSATGGQTTGTASGGTTASSSGSGTSTSSGTTGTASSSGGSTGGLDDGGCDCPRNQFCDPLDAGRCLICLGDSDCGGNSPVCDTNPTSSNYGLCVGCTNTESFCGPGLVCNHVWYTAMFESCVLDCRLSDAGAPCPDNPAKNIWQHCDLATGICLPGCTHANDCVPEAPFCTVSGYCVECLGPQDCSYANPGCHNGSCGFCVDVTECRPGQACSGEHCRCLGSSQCGSDAPVCEFPSETATLGSCGCSSSFDCAPTDRVCEPSYESYTYVAGACVPSCVDGGTDCLRQVFPFNYCNPTNGICATCSDDSQCLGDAGLTGAHCLDAGYCGCFAMGDCPDGTACDPFFNECAPSCVWNAAQCLFGTVCDPRVGLCVECLQDQDCIASAPELAYCLNDIDAGTSCVACLTPNQCPTDRIGCSSRTFQCGLCEQDSDCPSNYPHCIGPPNGTCA